VKDWSDLRQKAEAAKEQMENGPQEWPGRPSPWAALALLDEIDEHRGVA